MTADLLVISGGGDWGAFGAGFLKGWSSVQGPLAKPKFDAVTGVSTGALIAPFAFLGDAQSIETAESLYRNPKPDGLEKRSFFFLPSNPSFLKIPGLERDVVDQVDANAVAKIAADKKSGRLLLVNTTDLDDGGMWVWNLRSRGEARRRNA